MLEGRSAQFVHELMLHGATQQQAQSEVALSIDRWLHYAGWCDKYLALFSSVNPTNSSHFNFSVQEPTGVVGIMSPDTTGLLGLVSMIAPVITGGNTCIVIASESRPLPAVTFTEVLATSDLPGGVVNLLTGVRSELIPTFATHEHLRAISGVADADERKALRLGAAESVKRVHLRKVEEPIDWFADKMQGAEEIRALLEFKTTWHPIGA